MSIDHSRISTQPFPASEKRYLGGSLFPEVRVPVRAITLSPTVEAFSGVTRTLPNPPLLVPDTSGAYTDPAVATDLQRGLPHARPWLARSERTEETARFSALADMDGPLPYPHVLTPRRARSESRGGAGHHPDAGGPAR